MEANRLTLQDCGRLWQHRTDKRKNKLLVLGSEWANTSRKWIIAAQKAPGSMARRAERAGPSCGCTSGPSQRVCNPSILPSIHPWASNCVQVTISATWCCSFALHFSWNKATPIQTEVPPAAVRPNLFHRTGTCCANKYSPWYSLLCFKFTSGWRAVWANGLV